MSKKPSISILSLIQPLITYRKKSIFYPKRHIKEQSPPSLQSIYRKYIKQSVNIYNRCEPTIGVYFLRLLELKRCEFEGLYKGIREIQDMIEEVKRAGEKREGQQSEQKLDKKLININRLFKGQKITSLSTTDNFQYNQITKQSKLIQLTLQRQKSLSSFKQKLLYNFQCLHFYAQAIQKSLNLTLHNDTRTNEQLKILSVIFNVSKYVTPTLRLRPGYNSINLLGDLEEDFEFIGLEEKDKQFVRNVIGKVCGNTWINLFRYVNVLDYLKDQNAANYENKTKNLIRFTDKKDKINKLTQQNLTNKQENQDDETQQKDFQQENQENQQKLKNQWCLISQKQRYQVINTFLKQAYMSTFEKIKFKEILMEQRDSIVQLKKGKIDFQNLGDENGKKEKSQQQQGENKGQVKRIPFLDFFLLLKQKYPGFSNRRIDYKIRQQFTSLSKQLFKIQKQQDVKQKTCPLDQTQNPQKSLWEQKQLVQQVIYSTYKSSAHDGIASSNRFYKIVKSKKEDVNQIQLGLSGSQKQQTESKKPQIMDLKVFIKQSQILDEFINKKRVIIV